MEQEQSAHWDFTHREYTCVDGVQIVCRHETVGAEMRKNMYEIVHTRPRNGLYLQRDMPPTLVVRDMRMSRDATEVMTGGLARTYSLPPTVLKVCSSAFADGKQLQSVRLNGVRTLEEGCFTNTEIRRLVFPSSVRDIGPSAFMQCGSLQLVDLRASSLKSLDTDTFAECGNLKHVLLGEGLEYIGEQCFTKTGVEEVVFPSSIRRIGIRAFKSCKDLKRVSFGEGLEVIETYAFIDSGLESFAAPASLRKIGSHAF